MTAANGSPGQGEDRHMRTLSEIQDFLDRVFDMYGAATPGMAPQLPQHRAGAAKRYKAILSAIAASCEANEPLDALEVGVSEGFLLRVLIESLPDTRWVATDVANWNPELSRRREGIFENRCRIVEHDLSKAPLPFPDRSFDLVSFSEVLEHLSPAHVVPALKDMSRVLRPGGVLIATSPNLTSLLNRLLMLLGRSPFKLPIPVEPHGTYHHIHMYTPEEFCHLGEHAGLQTVSVRLQTYLAYAFFSTDHFRNAVLRAYLLTDRCVGWLLPKLRDGWVVAMKKPLSAD